jgi:hypothetical protein
VGCDHSLATGEKNVYHFIGQATVGLIRCCATHAYESFDTCNIHTYVVGWRRHPLSPLCVTLRVLHTKSQRQVTKTARPACFLCVQFREPAAVGRHCCVATPVQPVSVGGNLMLPLYAVTEKASKPRRQMSEFFILTHRSFTSKVSSFTRGSMQRISSTNSIVLWDCVH